MPDRFVLSMAVLLFLSPGLSAQDARAVLTGRVVDSTARVIPGVEVTAVNIGTNARAATVTNEAGYFSLPPLPAGSYTLSAELPGFKKYVRHGIVLRVQDRIELPIVLEVGEVSISVEVTEAVAPLQTATATTGQVIEQKLIADLPLSGRNPFLLSALAVGILSHNPPQIQRTFDVGGTNSISGGGPQRVGQGDNAFILDGVPLGAGGRGVNFVPSVSATQEFKIQTNTFDAEYGRTAGAVLNVSIKSGTNQLRGELYEFHRNSALDANDFFSNRAGLPKRNFLFNLFGASVGGPVHLPGFYRGRDRTFFFFNYEGVRQGVPSTYQARVPTELERQGDFSQSLNAAGQPIHIYDPLNPTPVGDGTYLRQAFPGNRIPAGRIDPVAARMLAYYPAPMTPSTRLGEPNFFKSGVTRDSYNQYIVRVDHHFSQANHFFARVQTSHWDDILDPIYGNVAEFIDWTAPFKRSSRGVALQDTHAFSPTSLLNLRYGYTRLVNAQDVVSQGFDFRTLGLPEALYQQVPLKLFPAARIDGFSPLGAHGSFISPSDGHSFQVSYTIVRGRHSLKWGSDFRAGRFNSGGGAFGASSGLFDFDAAFSQGPDPNIRSSTAGHPMASFLLGTPASGRIDSNAEAAFQGFYSGLFVQDDWAVTPRLTLNAGLRWEYEGALTERFNRMTRGFDYSAASPLQTPTLDLRGGLLFTDENNRSLGRADKVNLAPRLGLALRLTDRSVIRAGYGMFTGSAMSSYAGSFVQPGFSASTEFVSSLDGGITPANFLHNPFPQGLVQPTGSSRGLATFLGQAISFVDPDFVQPYSQNFTLNLQYLLPGGILFDAGYVGVRGSHLIWTRNLELNQLHPSFLSQGTQLQQTVPNPFHGHILVGALSGPMVARHQLLRPFPHFTSVQVIRPPIGNSTYHSLQLKLERQFTGDFYFLSSYTFSKLIDDVNQLTPVQNNYDLRAERSVADYDRPHRWAGAFLYELPFGSNKHFRPPAGVLNKLAEGWQINAVLQLQSGRPLAFTASPVTTLFGGGLRPNLQGAPRLNGRVQDRLNAFFDPAAFSVPAPFNFGNTARALAGLREPGLNVVDFSLIKKTSITERTSLEFRAEAFNALNRPNFGRPATGVGTATLGRITSGFGAPRQFQFGLKLLF